MIARGIVVPGPRIIDADALASLAPARARTPSSSPATRAPAVHAIPAAKAYPATSTFTSGDAGSCWWKVRIAGQTWVYTTQGKTFVEHVQARLIQALPAAYQSIEDIAQLRTLITVDGNFGPHTLLGLFKAVQYAMVNVPNSLLTAISQDWQAGTTNSDSIRYSVQNRGRSLSYDTTRAALWFAFHPSEQLEAIELPGEAVLPVWDLALPDDGAANGVVSRFQEGQTPDQAEHVTVSGAGGQTAGSAVAPGEPAIAVNVAASTWSPTKTAVAVGGGVLAIGITAAIVAAATKKKGHAR